MKWSLRPLTTLCLLISPVTATPYNLTSLTKKSLDNHPRIHGLEHAEDVKLSAQKKLVAGYLPKVTIGYQASKWSNQDNIGHESTLKARQRIFDGGRHSKWQTIQHEYQLAQLQTNLQTDAIKLNIEQAFLTAWLQQERKCLIESMQISAQKLFAKEKTRNDLGMSDKTDFLIAATQYTASLSKIHAYQYELDHAFAALEKASGQILRHNQNQPCHLTWNHHSGKAIPPFNQALSQALEQRNELKAFDHDIESWKHKEIATKTNYIPSVDLYENIYHTSNTPNTTLYSSFTHVTGIALSWDIFDGTQNYHASQQAHARMLQLRDEKEALKQSINAQISTAYNELEIQRWKARHQDIALAQGLSQFNKSKRQAAQGLLDQTSLCQANQAWHEAQFNWLSEKIAIATAEAVLINALGNT